MKNEKQSIKMKKLIYIVACIFVCVTVYMMYNPVKVQAATTYTSSDGDWNYTIVDSKKKTIEITKYKDNKAVVKIPTDITGKDKKKYKVVSIGRKAFYDNDAIKEVTIPASVEKIGANAFIDCYKLSKVTFEKDSKCKYIYGGAFACTGITKIIIPSTVECLYGSDGESSIWGAFERCSKLKTVVFENESKCKLIGPGTFCFTAISAINIPCSVIKISGYDYDFGAFQGCQSLQKVTFASGSKCESIGMMAFYNTAITSITIPSSVETIDWYAFMDCKKLSKVTFASGSKCESIGMMAFYNTAITSITIPSSVEEIEDGAFSNCEKLSRVTFASGSKCESIGKEAFYSTAITSITIPSSVKEIGKQALGYGEDDKGNDEFLLKTVILQGEDISLAKNAIAADTVYVENKKVYDEVKKKCEQVNRIIIRIPNYKIEFKEYDSTKKTWVSKKVTGPQAYDSKFKLSTYYNPKRNGYSLEWNTKSDGRGWSFDPEEVYTKLTGTGYITLYAIWTKKEYTIIYDKNGATWGSVLNQRAEYGSIISLRENQFFCGEYVQDRGVYVKNGVIQFKGWCLKKDGTGKIYDENSDININWLIQDADKTTITLYAIWTINIDFILECWNYFNNYSTLIWNGTDINYVLPKYEDVYNKTIQTGKYCERTYKLFWGNMDGYTVNKEKSLSEIADFYAWVNPGMSGWINWFYFSENHFYEGYKLYKPGDVYKIDKNKIDIYNNTFAAAYTYKDITISFDGKGANGSMDTIVCKNGKITSADLANQFVKDGREFMGWGVEYEDGVIELFTQSQIEDTKSEIYQKEECSRAIERLYILADDNLEVTLVPIWNGPDTYTVQYKANGASGSMSASEFECDTENILPACVMKRPGYTFEGWADASGDDTVIYKDGATINRSYQQGDIRLKAIWKANTYTVKYNANGGAGVMASEKSQAGEEFTLSANEFEKDGAEFVCWNTSADGSGTVYENSESLMYEPKTDGEVITLYAIWNMTTVKIYFNANGGTVGKSVKTVGYGDAAGRLPTPKYDGYTFDGWYTKKTGGTKYTGSTIVDAVGNITLYARWKAKQATVKFSSNGGKTPSFTSKKIKVGDSVGTFPKVKRDNYTFAGWYTSFNGGNKVTSSYKVSREEITLYAHWKQKNRNVNVTIKSIESDKQSVGCQIQYSSSKSFSNARSITKKNFKGNSVSLRIEGLKSNTKYYFRARTYKIVNGKKKYGKWSPVTKKKTSK